MAAETLHIECRQQQLHPLQQEAGVAGDRPEFNARSIEVMMSFGSCICRSFQVGTGQNCDSSFKLSAAKLIFRPRGHTAW